MISARIPRSVPKGRRKPNLRRAAEHLAFVRDIGICLACGRVCKCESMHVRNRTDGGTGLKPSDKFSVPGCPACHHRQHSIGEISFWGDLGIDPLDVSCRLWTVSGDLEQGRRCIEKARARMRLRVWPVASVALALALLFAGCAPVVQLAERAAGSIPARRTIDATRYCYAHPWQCWEYDPQYPLTCPAPGYHVGRFCLGEPK